MSLGSVSHVGFKKRMCRPVDFRGQWPSTYRPDADLSTDGRVGGVGQTGIQTLSSFCRRIDGTNTNKRSR